jgi:hypothetical protein
VSGFDKFSPEKKWLATKCGGTVKNLYQATSFEKSQREHNNLDYQMNLFHLWVP